MRFREETVPVPSTNNYSSTPKNMNKGISNTKVMKKDITDTKDVMQIKISFKDKELKIGFYDKGKPANPENIKHRKLDDVKPGGLGTFFIKQIMDEVVFKEAAGWRNHLVLTKNFNHQQ